MPFYPIVLELIQKAKESMANYCAGLEKSVCEEKLRKDFQEAFQNFHINLQPFFDYPLYALDENDTWVNHQEKPLFEPEVHFSLIKKNLTSVNPQEVDEALSTLNNEIITNSADGRWWPYGAVVGKFYESDDPSKAGMLSYDTNYPSLGILNYGYYMDGNNYVFKNDKEGRPSDVGCEDTQTKAASLYNGKFNCVYGHKYINEEVDELQIFKIRSPGFKEEDLYFIEPEIPYLTNHGSELPLYKQNGKFNNPQIIKYGAPLNIKEQSINPEKRVIAKLVEWCQ